MAEYIERSKVAEMLDAVYENGWTTKYSVEMYVNTAQQMLMLLPCADVKTMDEWISVKDSRKPINGECVLVIRRTPRGNLTYGSKYYYTDRLNPWDDFDGWQILCWTSLPPMPSNYLKGEYDNKT